MSGARYPLAGVPLTRLVPFAEAMLGISMESSQKEAPHPLPPISPPIRNERFLGELRAELPALPTSEECSERLVHSHGQLSVDEVHRIARGHSPARVVDLVVFPGTEQEAAVVVRLAQRHGVVLIPYGGGTNVTGALLPPAGEERMIVSLDLARMNRVLRIDPERQTVEAQAGITGKALEAALEAEGFTAGHMPDSIEFSTLGGWIATRASGMKKNRYGNIEEIVVDATLLSPSGELSTENVGPRVSGGVDPRSLLFGSEGCLGLITRATLQIRPLPEVVRYGSIVFPDFGQGVAFLKAAWNAGLRPASLRLVSTLELGLGRALSPAPSGFRRLWSAVEEAWLFRVRKMNPSRIAACTMVCEGGRREVREERRAVLALARRFGGVPGGEARGARGYATTFAIGYIRDFLDELGVLGETLESSVPWDRVLPMIEQVEAELHHLAREHGIPGRPYLSYRASQSYQTGICLYFTVGFCGRGVPEADLIFQQVERRLREVILTEGGSLSHHHGIGKIRRDFLAELHSNSAIRAIQEVKRALDPDNVFAAGNNVFGVPKGVVE